MIHGPSNVKSNLIPLHILVSPSSDTWFHTLNFCTNLTNYKFYFHFYYAYYMLPSPAKLAQAMSLIFVFVRRAVRISEHGLQ